MQQTVTGPMPSHCEHTACRKSTTQRRLFCFLACFFLGRSNNAAKLILQRIHALWNSHDINHNLLAKHKQNGCSIIYTGSVVGRVFDTIVYRVFFNWFWLSTLCSFCILLWWSHCVTLIARRLWIEDTSHMLTCLYGCRWDPHPHRKSSSSKILQEQGPAYTETALSILL